MEEALKYHRFLIVSSIFALVLSGCTLFTTSLGKGLARDNSENYDKQSSDDLIELSLSSEIINDQKESARILAALGKKGDLELLSGEKKDKVLDLLIGTTITSDALADSMNIIKNLSNDSDIVTFFDDMLDNVSSSDTAAVARLLNDNNSLEQMSPLSSCLASMCLLAQAAKIEGENKTFTDMQSVLSDIYSDTMQGQLDTPEHITAAIDNAIANNGNITDKSKDSVKAALNCAIYFKNNPDKVQNKVIGEVSVDTLFGAFTR